METVALVVRVVIVFAAGALVGCVLAMEYCMTRTATVHPVTFDARKLFPFRAINDDN